jgi:hypothetical protein
MKIKITTLVIIGILLTSCAPQTATQESEVSTETPVMETALTQTPVAMESSAEVPAEHLPTCVTLLAPMNDAEIPPVGKVTFSWTSMDETGSYVLNIILPSGETLAYETDQTFHDRYMEAFIAGGEYRWQVIAQNNDGSEICISEVATFNKVAYEKPNGDDGGTGGDGGNGGTGGDGGLLGNGGTGGEGGTGGDGGLFGNGGTGGEGGTGGNGGTGGDGGFLSGAAGGGNINIGGLLGAIGALALLVLCRWLWRKWRQS